MKPNELRIGNWIMGNAPFQVDAMQIALAESREREGFDIGWKPIPLTKEWLERFGFVKCQKGKLTIILSGKLGYKHGRTYYNSWTIQEHQPKYVHQLQNLYFALTGEEL